MAIMQKIVGGGPISLIFDPQFDDVVLETNRMIRRAFAMRTWLNRVLVPTLFRMEREQYRSEGGFGGDADLWDEPYSPKYEQKKLRQVGHLKKEILSGTLRRALTVRNSPHQILDVANDFVEFGANPTSEDGFEYASVQMTGTSDGNVAPRPPMPTEIPEFVIADLDESAAMYILDSSLVRVDV